MARQRFGYVLIDPALWLDEDFAALPVEDRWAYVDGLAADALAGRARPVSGPDEFGWCGVVLRQRRVFPQQVRQRIYDRDGNACLYCGASDRLELDHIIPLARGGADAETNLQTLCAPCNRRKWAHA